MNAAELAAGQAGGQPPASFTSQNGLYTGLVGAAPRLRAADLDRFFKAETFGVAPGRLTSPGAKSEVEPAGAATMVVGDAMAEWRRRCAEFGAARAT